MKELHHGASWTNVLEECLRNKFTKFKQLKDALDNTRSAVDLTSDTDDQVYLGPITDFESEK